MHDVVMPDRCLPIFRTPRDWLTVQCRQFYTTARRSTPLRSMPTAASALRSPPKKYAVWFLDEATVTTSTPATLIVPGDTLDVSGRNRSMTHPSDDYSFSTDRVRPAPCTPHSSYYAIRDAAKLPSSLPSSLLDASARPSSIGDMHPHGVRVA